MRKSGILLHITSLSGPEGIGTMGKEAYAFVDFLKASGFSIWQMLPIGPTGYGDSPYQSPSAFAGNPLLISLQSLCDEGLLDSALLSPAEPLSKVDFEKVKQEKERLLRACYAQSYPRLEKSVKSFALQNPWVSQYAAYQTLCDVYGAFQGWPLAARTYCVHPDDKISDILSAHAQDAAYYTFVQYLFEQQFNALKAYANEQGIELFGDMPIYAAPGSADVWANPKMFQLDETLKETRVAGVPPDYFSEDGQLWGNPLYDWHALRRDKYRWWIKRLKRMGRQFDILRIDHFIGFANYYSIPAGEKTARNGRWIKNRGKAFFKTVKKELPGLTVIAEDLGEVNKRVRRLIDYCGYPGMKVLVFAFSSDEHNQHLPKNVPVHSVIYTGTHDNDTALGWWQRAPQAEKDTATRLLNLSPNEDVAHRLVFEALQSKAELAVLPMQDILGLDNAARMNMPGTVGADNWRYRMLPGQLTKALQDTLLKLNQQCKRGESV